MVELLRTGRGMAAADGTRACYPTRMLFWTTWDIRWVSPGKVSTSRQMLGCGWFPQWGMQACRYKDRGLGQADRQKLCNNILNSIVKYYLLEI